MAAVEAGAALDREFFARPPREVAAELIGTIGFTLGLCAAGAVVGLMRLRRRIGPERVRVPGWPFVPLFFLAMTTFSSVYLARREPLQAATGLAIVAVGLVLGLVAHRRSVRTAAGESPASPG